MSWAPLAFRVIWRKRFRVSLSFCRLRVSGACIDARQPGCIGHQSSCGEASEAPASSSFPVVTWRITRDALSNVLMLSHGIAIVGCGGLTDLLLWREPPFPPDYSQVSIASMVFYVLVSVGIGNFPAASGTKVSVGYLKSAIAWLAAVLLLALVILDG